MSDTEKLKPTFSWPGIGGSLGKCAACGEDFITELFLGKSIATLHCEQLNGAKLPMHKECADKVQQIHDWRELPLGPLRTCFEQASPTQEGKP